MGVVELPSGDRERWVFGFMIDTVLTRDCWMHRMDTAIATGREPVLTADHDGVLVADIVAEWAGRHGEPCTLTLDGPAGGRWSSGPVVRTWTATPSSSAGSRPGAAGGPACWPPRWRSERILSRWPGR